MKRTFRILIAVVLVLALCTALTACDNGKAVVGNKYKCLQGQLTLTNIEEGTGELTDEQIKEVEDEQGKVKGKYVTLTFEVDEDKEIPFADFKELLESDRFTLNGEKMLFGNVSMVGGKSGICLGSPFSLLFEVDKDADLNSLELKIGE